jgi:ubiquinone/menaquinone biosynthesis C-methylase UbiE
MERKEPAMRHPGTLHTTTAEANASEREFWSAQGAQQYDAHDETNNALMAPFGAAMFDEARLQPGEDVLDVGCGHGMSTVEAAEAVAPNGRVVGIDISPAMLEPARQRVANAGLDNVELVEGDAQVYPFEAESFDVVISRFGLMFFDDAEAAFANLARALRSGGRLAFVCPRDPLSSEWVKVALGAAVQATGRPPDLGAPGAPGPFSLADKDRIVHLLKPAGFTDLAFDELVRPVRLGRTVEDATAYILSLPQSQELFAGAPQQTMQAAAAALRTAFAPYTGTHGVVLDSSGWLVLARR